MKTDDDSFVLQGRTLLAQTSNGTLSQEATVWGGFALLSGNESAVVQIQITEDRTGRTLFGFLLVSQIVY